MDEPVTSINYLYSIVNPGEFNRQIKNAIYMPLKLTREIKIGVTFIVTIALFYWGVNFLPKSKWINAI